jgi:alkanesulfonate monooxygenase SsuD/methylene tetrahydromethanopterin reductase-like flavin-dependent oxidoreductase (luciferase family)
VPYWLESFDRVSRSGVGHADAGAVDAEIAHGSMFVGSPETVAQRRRR